MTFAARVGSARRGALRACAVGAALVGTLPTLGQVAPEAPRVTGAVELTLINVDVVVTGKDGKPVEGLTAADFTVLHAKRPVAITNFREERASPPPPPAAAAPAAPSAVPTRAAESAEIPEARRVPRHVVLFIDHLALPDVREREQVFGSLKRLLKESLQPGDGAMIVAWRGGVQTVYPFTDDLSVLDRCLDTVSKTAIRLGRDSQEEIDKLAGDDWAYAWAQTGDSDLSRNLDVQQAFAEMKGKATALKGLIATMSGMEGRKALVLASRSFSTRPGVEFMGATLDAGRLVEEVADKANAAGVTLHSLYAAAWESDMPNVTDSRFVNPRLVGPTGLTRSDSKRVSEVASLKTMSGRTGGVVIGTTMESHVFADLVSSDLRHWYSIGYPAPPGAPRSAEVSVRVNRPGVVVRTRRSVVERSPVEAIEDRVLANLFRMDAGARLPIAVSSGAPKKEKKGRWVTTAVVRVPVRHLVLVPTASGVKGAVSIFTVAAGPGGEFSEVRRERHDVELPASSAGPASTEVLTYETGIAAGDPAARISIGVWDETGGEAGFRLIRTAAR